MNTKENIQKDIALYLTVYDYSKMSKDKLIEQIKEKSHDFSEMSKEQLIEYLMFVTGENSKVSSETIKKLVKIGEHFGKIEKNNIPNKSERYFKL